MLVVDRLAGSALEMFPRQREGLEIIDVGKCPGKEGWAQEQINALLVEKANEGKTVVRLKGGDPLVFGRAVEEVQACERAGIKCTIVPGLSSALAAPTLAGIPLTLRGVSSSFHVMTGKLAEGEDEEQHWREMARLPGTLVILMGVKALPKICAGLLAGGKDPETPAAIIERASLPDQRVTIAPLRDLAAEAQRVGVEAPAVTVIGEVVAHRVPVSIIHEHRSPILGRRIAVTTSRDVSEFSEPHMSLETVGAEIFPLPLFEYLPIHRDEKEINALLDSVRSSDCVLFSSARAVSTFRDHLTAVECDVRKIGSAEILTVGESTADAVVDRLMLRCTHVPEPGGVAGLKKLDVDFEGKRVLWLRGREARPETRTVLEERGATVEEAILYESHPLRENRDRLLELLRHRALDAVTFGSARGAEAAFADLPEEERRTLTEGVCLAVIGPATAKALEALGLRADVVPLMPDQLSLAAGLICHFHDRFRTSESAP